MNYMLMLYVDESHAANMTEAEGQALYSAYYDYTEALKAAGVFTAGDPLQPVATATRVTVGSDGTSTVLDGPYADTKEQLAGYYILDVPDLDGALAWAARCPAAHKGVVEVRPIMSM
jgi:hypothetical protein